MERLFPDRPLEFLSIADNNAKTAGGGIYAAHGSGTTRLRYCRLSYNYANTGGAMHYQSGARLTMANNQFAFNGGLSEDEDSPHCLYGGALYLGQQVSVEAANCIFHDNAAIEAGGAIFWQPLPGNVATTDRQYYRNCTITLNAVQSPGGGALSAAGAGMHVGPADYIPGSGVIKEVYLYNTINYGNRFGQDVTVEGVSASPPRTGILMQVNYSCMSTNVNDDTTSPGGINITNSTTSAPNFVSIPGRDLRLTSGSPCENTGNDTLCGEDLLDIDFDGLAGGVGGEVLPWDFFMMENRYIGTVDMGALERQ